MDRDVLHNKVKCCKCRQAFNVIDWSGGQNKLPTLCVLCQKSWKIGKIQTLDKVAVGSIHFLRHPDSIITQQAETE